MNLKKTLLTLCLALTSSSLASGQVKFDRKIEEGKTSKVESVSRSEQKLTIAGMDIETSSDSRTVVRATAGKRDADGNLRIEEKVDSLQISVKIQGTEYEFDSANPEKTGGSPLEMLRPVHKGAVRRTTTTTYDKDNKVADIQFDQDPLNDLNDTVRALVKDQFDIERIKKAANEEIDRLPGELVKKGDSWERMTKLHLEAGQIMTFNTRYTYEGEIEKDGRKLDRISSKVLSVDYTIENPVQFSAKSSDLKPAASKGELLFDRAAGQIVESSSSVQIVGDLTLVINNMELPAKLDLKMESSTQKRNE